MNHFILEPHDYHDPVIYLAVADGLAKEAREYIGAHTPYDIVAVVGEFTRKPEVTPLRRFLENDLDEMLRRFWFTLWVDEDDFPLDEFRRLARKQDWEMVFSEIWDVRRHKLQAEAPHKVYKVSSDTPTLSGDAGVEETDEVIPLKDVLARGYVQLEEALVDIERAYRAGRKILDRLPACQEGRQGE